MDQALFRQEIQRPVDRGGRGAGLGGAQGVEQFVGLETAMMTQQCFQHQTPQGRQPRAAPGAEPVRRVQASGDFGMRVGMNLRGHDGYVIT